MQENTQQDAEPRPIALTNENLDALREKHHQKIDRAVRNDSETQEARLRLFGHDPDAIVAHYPELQEESERLRKQNLTIRGTASAVGWTAMIGTAIATGYAAIKKRIHPENNLIQGGAVALASLTAGLIGNYATERLLGKRNREESRDLAAAARTAYERELAPYMEMTERQLSNVSQEEIENAKRITEQQKKEEAAHAHTHTPATLKSRDATPLVEQPESGFSAKFSGNAGVTQVDKITKQQVAANDAQFAQRA